MDTSRMYEFPIKEFFKQPRSLLGAGAYENAGPEAAAMGLNHVLFVTSGLEGTGIIDECKTNFENAGVSVTVYDKVESNPKDYNVMDAYKAFSEGECDGFVSIGGGSSHDTTKGARIVAAHDGRNVNEFQEVNASETLDNPAHIAINTTVGTGSETTPAYVITDLSSPDAPHKWVGFDRAAITTLAINDPCLMLTQPPQYVAYTGFDTMAHASECYVGRVQHLSTTPVALAAIKLTQENLREATYNPNNYKAMEGMVWAQYTAAQAFSTGLLGILHSLARGLRLLRHSPRPEQRCRVAEGVDVQPACGAREVRGYRWRNGRGYAQHDDLAGGRRGHRGSHTPRQGLRLPGELGRGRGVPEDQDGQGPLRGQDQRGHPVGRRRAAEDGRAHDERPLHAG